MGKGAERPRLGRPGGRALRPCIPTKFLHSYIFVIVAVLLLSRLCNCRGFVTVAVLIWGSFVMGRFCNCCGFVCRGFVSTPIFKEK